MLSNMQDCISFYIVLACVMASKNINGTKEGKCFENLLSAISGVVPSSYQLPEVDLSGKVAIVTGPTRVSERRLLVDCQREGQLSS